MAAGRINLGTEGTVKLPWLWGGERCWRWHPLPKAGAFISPFSVMKPPCKPKGRDLENVRTGEHVMMDKRDGGSSSPFPMLSLCILHRAVPEPCPAITTRDAASKVLL